MKENNSCMIITRLLSLEKASLKNQSISHLVHTSQTMICTTRSTTAVATRFLLLTSLKLKSWMFQTAVIQPQLPETRPRSLLTCRITRIVIPWNLTSIREMTKLEFERTSLIVLIASHFQRNILRRSLNNQKLMRILSHI